MFFPTGRIGLFLICLSCLSACAASSAKTVSSAAKMQQAVPVTITTVTQKTVPVQLQAIGNVQAYSTVSVKPQVGGELTGVYFKQGQNVKKGQLLFTIDDRPLKAALQQAQGNLAKDMAQVKQTEATLNKDIGQVKQARATQAKDEAQEKNAEVETRRYTNLSNQGVVSKEQADQYRTNADALDATVVADKDAIENAEAAVNAARADVQTAEATVSADRGTVENAEVQLSYTKVYSPMDGRTGNLLVDRGNIVQANSTTALVTISQIRPIQASFSVPEQELPEIKKYMATNKLKVEAIFPKDSAHPIPGVLTFVNSTVDNTTGTIQLLGDFANFQERLWPGEFVNVILTLTTEPNAVIVPSQAVQAGQNGKYVFVLKPDSTVESRAVAVSSTINGQDVIAQGLQPGEKVVTDGQSNLVPGAKVQVKTAMQSGGSAS